MPKFHLFKQTFPDANHVMPDALDRNVTAEGIPSGSFIYVPVECYGKLANLQADLYSNFFSFGEMPEDVLVAYLESKTYTNAKRLYLVNRVVSSPFFEQVYDNSTNILDYGLNKNNVEYFDLFPIHHYNIINRTIFGRRAPRNYSSNYFEVVVKT